MTTTARDPVLVLMDQVADAWLRHQSEGQPEYEGDPIAELIGYETDVFRTPATSFDGLIAKVRLAYRIWRPETKDSTIVSNEPIDASEAPDMSEVAGLADEVMIWSIIQDMERLAAGLAKSQ